ncbi:glycine zipper 2TM domain-containing protein [Massilia sp. CF038]|uniref:glycine zipper 2TM domain-containing protein n=1 Tax=Massilia sp. CF038 TaxID=1881045 RepID=UPI000918F9BB|nr:glycine zipper 2TM domain-containing protein [Massilia sp. CF038]SHH17451.1 Glycine zipper 2TM domain-containing protein [Massilia sp. CF038]
MLKRPYFLGMILGFVMLSAQAAPRDQYETDTREAAARYAEDRAICNDERNNGQRMKCLRAAKEENTRLLAEAKARNPGNDAQRGGGCNDCAKVLSVNVSTRKGESNALGLIGGGVVGGLLGNQVGGGNGRKVATVAGAVGGAYAGKKIQESANSTKVWNVEVEYENGQRRTFGFEHDPQLQRGDRVRNAGKSITRM